MRPTLPFLRRNCHTRVIYGSLVWRVCSPAAPMSGRWGISGRSPARHVTYCCYPLCYKGAYLLLPAALNMGVSALTRCVEARPPGPRALSHTSNSSCPANKQSPTNQTDCFKHPTTASPPTRQSQIHKSRPFLSKWRKIWI